jgi:hypothetical protein
MNNNKNYGIAKQVVFIFISGLIYALLRYVVFKGVSLENIPLYIMNKVFALTGITLIAFSVVLKRKNDTNRNSLKAKQLGQVGYSFIIIHLLCSLPILNENYCGLLFFVCSPVLRYASVAENTPILLRY